MKLKEACALAENFDLITIREAVDFIDIHASSLFPYDDITDELRELKAEYMELPEDVVIIEDLLK